MNTDTDMDRNQHQPLTGIYFGGPDEPRNAIKFQRPGVTSGFWRRVRFLVIPTLIFWATVAVMVWCLTH